LSKVYLIQETGKWNITPALDFGEVKVLLPPQFNLVFDTENVVKHLQEKLEGVTTKDYLLLSGDPALIGIATAIAADYLDGEINLLKWDRQEKIYIPIKLSLYGE
jgi:hypothetical protein